MKKNILFSFVTASLTFLAYQFFKIETFHHFKLRQEENFPFENGYYNFKNPEFISSDKVDSVFFYEKLNNNEKNEIIALVSNELEKEVSTENGILSTKTSKKGIVLVDNVLFIVSKSNKQFVIEDSYDIENNEVVYKDIFYSDYQNLFYLVGVDKSKQNAVINTFQPNINEINTVKSWKISSSDMSPSSICVGSKDNYVYVVSNSGFLKTINEKYEDLNTTYLSLIGKQVKIRFEKNGNLQTLVDSKLFRTYWVKIHQNKQLFE
jgi:hypothetical protein